MANKLHKDLTSDEIHVPKGFPEAATETALVKNANGDLEYRALDVLGETGPQGPQGPNAAAIQNVVVVNKSPGPDQFSTIQAAIDSITDASATNRYLVKVGPGIFQESIVMKPFVDVQGSTTNTTIIEAANTSDDAVTGADDCILDRVLVRGSTDAGKAGIRYTPSASNKSFRAGNVIFGSNDTLIHAQSNGFIGELIVTEASCEPDADFTNGFLVEGSGAQLMSMRIYRSLIPKVLAPFPSFLFRVDGGANAELVVFNCVARSGGGSTHGLHAQEGGKIEAISCSLQGMFIAIHSSNVGAAPTFQCGSIVASECTTDINITHPGTLGFIQGAFDNDKVNVDVSSPIALSYVDAIGGDKGSVTLGDILQGSRHDRLINVSKLIRDGSTMGLSSGGVISDGGGLNVNVTAGSGFLVDPTGQFVKEVSWNATTLTIPSESSEYIFVNTNGIVSQSAGLPSLSETIVLGRVTSLTSAIHFLEQVPMSTRHQVNELSLFNREAFGPVYASGSLVTENSGTPLALDVSSGNYWFAINQFLPSGGVAINFDAYYRKAVSGFNVIINNAQVSNAQYDDGSGTLANLGTGKFAKHSFYVTGDGADEKYFLVYSQDQYDTLIDAEGADIPAPPTAFEDSVALIATIIVQQGVANIVKILDARPVLGFKAPGISASATHGNLFGLGSDDHPQYLLATGGRAMSGNLNMGGNNVTNVGTVDGIDPSAHGARHNPGGADPIATAAPVTANADGNNNVGTANSVARSDHKHNVSVGSPVGITDTTTAPGTANSLARSDHQHAHGNRGGGSLHATAVGGGTPANGFMSGTDKVKLDTFAQGHLQYSKNTQQTTTDTTNGIALTFPQNQSSFPNSLLTKLSDTQIRTDYDGQVEMNFNVYCFPGANDRSFEVFIRKNLSNELWTIVKMTGKGDPNQGQSATASFILDCANGDTFEVRLRSVDGTLMTIPANRSLVRAKVERIATP